MELQYEILDDDTVRIIKAAVSDDELEITIPKTYQDKKISEIGREKKWITNLYKLLKINNKRRWQIATSFWSLT